MTVLDGTFIGIHKDVGFVSMRVTAGGSGRNHIMTLSTQGSESDGSSSSHVFLLLAQAGVGGGGGSWQVRLRQTLTPIVIAVESGNDGQTNVEDQSRKCIYDRSAAQLCTLISSFMEFTVPYMEEPRATPMIRDECRS